MTIFREDIAALIPSLRAFARALTANDRPLADDLVQDTMVRALQAQDRFRPGTNLEAWLFTILRNRFRNLRRRHHVASEIGMDDLSDLAAMPPAQETGIEIAAFRQAFRRLAPAHREMLILVGVRGLSYDQAAELCGCEVGTAKSRAHRARAILRAMLVDDDATGRIDMRREAVQPSAQPGRAMASSVCPSMAPVRIPVASLSSSRSRLSAAASASVTPR